MCWVMSLLYTVGEKFLLSGEIIQVQRVTFMGVVTLCYLVIDLVSAHS